MEDPIEQIISARIVSAVESIPADDPIRGAIGKIIGRLSMRPGKYMGAGEASSVIDAIRVGETSRAQAILTAVANHSKI